MVRLIACLVAIAAITGPVDAKNRLARNGAIVLFESKSDATFRVLGRAGFGASDYFCAAGEFARFTLSARPVDRIVLIKPPTREDRTVGFELRRGAPRAALLNRDPFLSLKQPGQSRSVGHADGLCRPPRFRLGDHD